MDTFVGRRIMSSKKKMKKSKLPPLLDKSLHEEAPPENDSLLLTPVTTTTIVSSPGTQKSAGSLHFDSLYPDIIEDGENIDYYVPETAGSNLSVSNISMSMGGELSQSRVSLQDVYQDVRSPVYSGEAPFFVSSESHLDDTRLALGESLLEDSLSASSQLLDLSQDLSLDEVEDREVTNTIHPTSATPVLQSKTSLPFIEQLYHTLQRHFRSNGHNSTSSWWNMDLTVSSSDVDGWMEKTFPESVVRALVSFLPQLWIELVVIVPRSVLTIMLFVSRTSWKASLMCIQWYIFFCFLPLRTMSKCVHALWTN
jgi:hypothetical protein